MSEWTPLDDIGRSQATIVHNLRQMGPTIRRIYEAQDRAVANMDRFLDAWAAIPVDWSEVTDSEAQQMALALDTIYGVRAMLVRDDHA